MAFKITETAIEPFIFIKSTQDSFFTQNFTKELKMRISDILYFIPDIKLIGYGRLQTFQCVCVRCNKLYFNLSKEKEAIDLFCSYCKYNEAFIEEKNKSFVNYIGNVVGWEIKSSTYEGKKRSFYNYKKVYIRDCYQCQYCGYSLKNSNDFKPLHIDHLRPWSASGSNAMNNLVVACSTCNKIASNKLFSSFYEKKLFINKKNPSIENVIWEFCSISN